MAFGSRSRGSFPCRRSRRGASSTHTQTYLSVLRDFAHPLLRMAPTVPTRGARGPEARLPGPRASPFRTAPHIEALVLRVRQERQYGVPPRPLVLPQHPRVSLAPPTIRPILRQHHV